MSCRQQTNVSKYLTVFLNFNKVPHFRISFILFHGSLLILCRQTDKLNTHIEANVHIFQFVVWGTKMQIISHGRHILMSVFVKVLTKHFILFTLLSRKQPNFYVIIAHNFLSKSGVTSDDINPFKLRRFFIYHQVWHSKFYDLPAQFMYVFVWLWEKQLFPCLTVSCWPFNRK